MIATRRAVSANKSTHRFAQCAHTKICGRRAGEQVTAGNTFSAARRVEVSCAVSRTVTGGEEDVTPLKRGCTPP
eukprot:1854549-Prymnesium_polylepis.2